MVKQPPGDPSRGEPSAPANLLTVWSRLLVDCLWSAGVRQAVISPGSRSTPLLAALLEQNRLELFSMVDERAAAFFALGLAKASGRPPLLLCTSGSAGAHYYPAVLEAESARLPLLIVTADRPPELHGCGAPQTVDQQHLYGSHARFFADLGPPEAKAEALLRMATQAGNAFRASLSPVPGPVQLNMPARKPLEPVAAVEFSSGSAERQLEQLADQARTEPLSGGIELDKRAVDEALPEEEALAQLAATLVDCDGGLIVAGPRPFSGADETSALASSASDLANRLGFVFAPEATSGLRYGQSSALACFSSMMRCDGARELLPEVVLQIGRPPVATSWYGFVERVVAAGGRLVVVSADPECDPTRHAESILVAEPARVCRELLERIPQAASGQSRPDQSSSGRAVRRIEDQLRQLQTESLDASGDRLSEAAAVRKILARLPAGALLAVGNSLPIRLLEEWGGQRSETILVDCQRGLNGIDGLVAGFAGLVRGLETAPPKSGTPPGAVLILGDVSALHDVGGFAALAEIQATRCAVVVLNNDGGRIFEQLPVRSTALWQDESSPSRGRDFWLTPHGRSFRPIADLFGLKYARPETVDCLADEVGRAVSSDDPSAEAQVHLIEVPLPSSGYLEMIRVFERKLLEAGLLRFGTVEN